jgi:hypothetical protein
VSLYRESQVTKIVDEVIAAGNAGRTRAELAKALSVGKNQYLYGLIDDALATGIIKALRPKNQHNRLLWVYVGNYSEQGVK